ncbi:uncharacterized protein [Procambarus clarkii]|uniref:uncharacterized protein n=1 Tax=Procambarus clarkii TaxID=6728 RepID=UPI003744973B
MATSLPPSGDTHSDPSQNASDAFASTSGTSPHDLQYDQSLHPSIARYDDTSSSDEAASDGSFTVHKSRKTLRKERKLRGGNNSVKTTNVTPTTGGAPRPTLAPRNKYARLAFPSHVTSDQRYAWMRRDLPNHFPDPIDLIIPRHASPYIYVARSDEVTISALLQGRVGGITFSKADSPERSRRYREYLVTSYPRDLDVSHAKELPGVHSARRIKSGGKPLNRIVIVWEHETPPPSHHTFLGPYQPACPITPWASSAVMCFNCQHFGHVAKHCQSSGTCAFCAANHLAKDCPNKDHAPGTDETTSSATKHKCSRCLREGVTAWHKDCVRRPPPHSTVRQLPAALKPL